MVGRRLLSQLFDAAEFKLLLRECKIPENCTKVRPLGVFNQLWANIVNIAAQKILQITQQGKVGADYLWGPIK